MLRLALLLSFALPPWAMAEEGLTVTRVVPAGTVLNAGDIRPLASDDPDALHEIRNVVGQEARVALYPGRPILARHLGSPTLIERNQIVQLVYQSGGLQILAEGRALGRAGAGELIRIMNVASRQTVSGLVQADGTIVVGWSE